MPLVKKWQLDEHEAKSDIHHREWGWADEQSWTKHYKLPIGKWTKSASNPIVSPDVPWENNEIWVWCVLYINNQYKAWYDADEGVNRKFGYAYSDDGVSWTKYSGNPVLTKGADGEWDDNRILYSSVYWDLGVYYALYAGHDGASYRLGIALSSDGFSFSKYPFNPILDLGSSGSWDDAHVVLPNLIRMKDEFKMYYSGRNGAPTWKIGLATIP